MIDFLKMWSISKHADDRRLSSAAPQAGDSARVRRFRSGVAEINRRLSDPTRRPMHVPPPGVRSNVIETLAAMQMQSRRQRSRFPVGSLAAVTVLAGLAMAVVVFEKNLADKHSHTGGPTVAAVPGTSPLPSFDAPKPSFLSKLADAPQATLAAAVEAPLRREADALAADTRSAARAMMEWLPTTAK